MTTAAQWLGENINDPVRLKLHRSHKLNKNANWILYVSLRNNNTLTDDKIKEKWRIVKKWSESLKKPLDSYENEIKWHEIQSWNEIRR